MAKNIAIIVHNSTVSDSRVLRSANALVEAGHSVHCFGIGKYPDDYEKSAWPFQLTLVDPASLQLGYRVYQSVSFRILSLFRRLLLRVVRAARSDEIGNSKTHGSKQDNRSLNIANRLIALGIILRQRGLAELLYQSINGHTFDAYYCHDIPALLAGCKLKRKNMTTKLVWDAHEIYQEMGNGTEARSLAMHAIVHQCAPKIDQFITINDNIASYYADRHNLINSTVITNACSRKVSSSLKSPLRQMLSVSDKEKIILYQGGFSPGRGLEELAEAARYAPEHWHFVFMGEGPLKGVLLDKAKVYDEKLRKLHILPPVPRDDLEMWSSGADLGVIPYKNTCLNHKYCTPNKLWEYPAAGVPVLATGLVEIKRRIDDYNCGIALQEEWTPQDLAGVLGSLSDNELADYKIGCEDLMEAENWERSKTSLLSLFADL